MRKLRRAATRFFAGVPDEAACEDIAQSARAFSRDAKAIVDDKLAFTETLMRAGEVEAANRLIAEVEHDVMAEAATLLQRVEEVQKQQQVRRRFVHLQPAASMVLLVAGLFAFSAAGASVVSVLTDDSPRRVISVHESDSARRARHAGADSRHHRNHGERSARQSAARAASRKARVDAARTSRLAVISFAGNLQTLLMGLLPNGVADRVQEVIVAAQESQERVSRAAPGSVGAPDRSGAPAAPAAPGVPANEGPPSAPGLTRPAPPAPLLEPTPSPEGLLTPVPNRPR